MTLREEIKSACDYRPFEKCDYIARVSNEICCKKLEYVAAQLDGMKQTIDEYHNAIWSFPHANFGSLLNFHIVKLIRIVRTMIYIHMFKDLLKFNYWKSQYITYSPYHSHCSRCLYISPSAIFLVIPPKIISLLQTLKNFIC